MKKVFKLAAIAAIASMTLVACNNNNTEATDTIDSTAIEQIADEEIIAEPAEVLDTTPVVEEQKAEPVKKAAKKTAQKAAQQLEKAATETATQATSATVDQVKSTQQQQPKTAPIKRNR
jgi:hypothetical protein